MESSLCYGLICDKCSKTIPKQANIQDSISRDERSQAYSWSQLTAADRTSHFQYPNLAVRMAPTSTPSRPTADSCMDLFRPRPLCSKCQQVPRDNMVLAKGQALPSVCYHLAVEIGDILTARGDMPQRAMAVVNLPTAGYWLTSIVSNPLGVLPVSWSTT